MIFWIPSDSGYSMNVGLGKSIDQFIRNWLKIIEVQFLIEKVWHPSLLVGENVTKPEKHNTTWKRTPWRSLQDTEKKGEVRQ